MHPRQWDTILVRCHRKEHTITAFENGRLRLEDHPGFTLTGLFNEGLILYPNIESMKGCYYFAALVLHKIERFEYADIGRMRSNRRSSATCRLEEAGIRLTESSVVATRLREVGSRHLSHHIARNYKDEYELPFRLCPSQRVHRIYRERRSREDAKVARVTQFCNKTFGHDRRSYDVR